MNFYSKWATISAAGAVQELQSSSTNGLNVATITINLKKYGKNSTSIGKRSHFLIEIGKHLKSPLLILLIVATIISYSLGETANATIILLIIIVSVGIDYFQDRDARNAAERLKETVKNKSSVVRNGKEIEIFHEEIVVGDIVLLFAGKIIPADGKIIEANDCFVNQSSLTGESFPAQKNAAIITGSTSNLSDLSNIVFMGSSVISGMARVIIIQTGNNTEFGKIAIQLASPEIETEFSKGIRAFGYLIMKVTIVLVLFIFLINSILKHDILETFMFSLAVAVGLTPELLPMIMAVSMSKGSTNIAKKGVIVKKLTAIPNFGSMNVLCTDKTGTITENKIQLIKNIDADGKDSSAVLLFAYLNSYFQTAIKNPLDDAVISYYKPDIKDYIKKDEIPFDFIRKKMSVVVTYQNSNILICKGAPEEIFKACKIDDDVKKSAQNVYEQLSNDGFRVLAIATKATGSDNDFTIEDEFDMTLVGFIGFLDPPKEDAMEVIASLKDIGVEVKIITGDNLLVTQHICRQIGLPVKGVLQGFEMDILTDEVLQKKVMETTLFTRFSPEQKKRVIVALQAQKQTVGFLGDGINDAPSLKAADIGISVSNGTDVAKDAADIILTQKNLLVLKEGILEGRKTFGNTMKYILMGLSSNFGNMFSVAAATLFLPYIPMLPVQILLNNFLYDTSQIAIPTDSVDEKYIQQPKHWNIKMIYSYMFIFGITSSLFDIITFYLLYSAFKVSENQLRTGWFMESLATQILVVFIIRTREIPFIKSKPSKNLTISVLACLFIGWLLPYSPFSNLLHFQPLPNNVLTIIIVLVVVYLITAEIVKQFIYKFVLKEIN
jgi:Mg2+-importing ATPase